VSTETRPDAKDPPVLISPAAAAAPRLWAGFRLRHLMYLALYCALILWLGAMTGLVLISGLLGLCLAIVFGAVYIYAGRRSTQQDALLWALAVTADRGMPLAATLDAVASQCRGEYRRKVLAAAHYLRQGFSLPETFVHEPGLFPRDAEALTRTGHDCGKLAAALRESATIRARLLRPWMALAVRLAYLFWVLIVLQMISGFVAYFILPKYEAIFADFGIPLPAITNLTIDVSHFFISFFYILLPFLFFELGLLMLTSVSALGVLPWELPLVGTIFYRRHTALVLRCLAYVVEANKPIAPAIEAMARDYPSASIRYRLRWVAHDLSRGDDWCDSLAQHRLIGRPEASLLAAAIRVGNLPWALRQAAENSERRLMYRFQMWVQWVLPLFVLAVGAVVFVIVMAYFTPLLVLIEKLAS
jgi:type II secretory pathway component PulF